MPTLDSLIDTENWSDVVEQTAEEPEYWRGSAFIESPNVDPDIIADLAYWRSDPSFARRDEAALVSPYRAHHYSVDTIIFALTALRRARNTIAHRDWQLWDRKVKSNFDDLLSGREKMLADIEDHHLFRDASSLPVELSHLTTAIERSRGILELQDNWDDEGSPGYTQSTWEQARSFVLSNAENLYYATGIRVSAPAILPGPDGNVEIQWQHQNRRLLINIPANPTDAITFYGDDRGHNVIEGSSDDPTRNQGLLMWLTD